MKKLIFIFLSLALFAGNQVLGQALPGSPPRPSSCVGDALHPIAGNPYPYQAAADPAGGNFLFWATKNQNFITTVAGTTTTNIATMLLSPTTTPPGTDLIATSANYANASATDVVTITWSDAILAATDPVTSPTFVSVYYTAPAGSCADNFRVWSIDPLEAFTVDIKNIENTTYGILGYDAAEQQCNDQVRGAVFNAGTVEYDFGTQILYFEVVAANFTGSWDPTFTLTGLHAVQSAVIEWTYDNPTTTPWGPATIWNPEAAIVNTTATNTSTGVSIYVRVTVTNNNYEGVADRPITLAVDGQNSVGAWDIVNNDPSQPGIPLCVTTLGPDQFDFAIQTLTERPDVTPVTPIPFVVGDNVN